MELGVFSWVFICHWFGDYVLQTKNMALNKKNKGWEGRYWCFLHATIYTLPFYVWIKFIAGFVDLATSFYCVVILLTHYVVNRRDVTKWRYPGLEEHPEGPYWKPSLYIAFDNGIHIVVALLSYWALLKIFGG